MKNLIFVFATLTMVAFTNFAQAQQLDLPFKSSDEVLLAAMPWSPNVRLINNVSALPSKIVKALDQVDLAFEMGDGYYNLLASAVYEVADEQGRVVGYIEAGFLSYTEDPEYFLGMAFINSKGKRLEVDPNFGSYEAADLPSELQPVDND